MQLFKLSSRIIMTSNEVKTLLYKYLKENVSVPVYKDVHPPITETSNFERVVVNINAIEGGTIERGFANINYYVPDIIQNYPEPDNAKLNIAEGLLKPLFNHGVLLEGVSGTLFCVIHKINQEADNFSHFININLLLTITNF